MPEAEVTIGSEEWLEISRGLEEHHALFYQCWSMGRPSFTRLIDTACVTFNRDGDYIEFLFNPDFWRTLTLYERLFVISHECLHVALRHGLRTTSNLDPPRTNIALDIVVNHLLTRCFGFDREKIHDADQLCWIDTVFEEEDRRHMPEDESFEFYYRLVPKTPVVKVYILDDHSKLSGDWSKVIGKLNDGLSPEEKEAIKGIIEKHCTKDGSAQAGQGTGGWHFINAERPTRKRKWETVIKQWSLKYLRQDLQDKEQWARLQRRWTMLPEDMILPSEMEEEEIEKDRLPVFLFLDTSGSCIHFKDRFWAAGASLPKDRFDVRMFCFDTAVKETNIDSKKVYGGGGTSFSIIEQHIRKLQKEEGIDYPEAVFLITDGYGDPVAPLKPHNWYWFMTAYSTKQYIPAQSKVYELKDYE